MFIDSHCHLYIHDFEADLDEVIKRATNAGVDRFYFPAIDKSTAEDMMRVVARFPGKCIPMMGLHPCSVNERFQEEMDFVEAMLKHQSFAAIGEIGLDYYWDKQFIQLQQQVFIRQIELANQYQLPIVIHTREAMEDTIRVVKDRLPDKRGIFHCFGGTLEQAQTIAEMGFKLGIGGVLTYKKSGLAAIIEKIPLKDLVLETDAPYLPPVPYRGKRNESSYLPIIAGEIARIKNVPIEEVAEITSQNTLRLFAL